MNKLKILVVEDTKKHIDSAKRQLKGHDITIVKSFKEFLVLSKHGMSLSEYDAVLTDVELPSLIDNDPSNEAIAPTGLIIMTKALAEGVKYVGVITDANHHMNAIARGFDFWLHSIIPINLGKSMLFLMADDACTYPRKDVDPAEYENVSKKKMLKGGAMPKKDARRLNMAGWVTFTDPNNADEDCKNWARLLRILTQDYIPSDIESNNDPLMAEVFKKKFTK